MACRKQGAPFYPPAPDVEVTPDSAESPLDWETSRRELIAAATMSGAGLVAAALLPSHLEAAPPAPSESPPPSSSPPGPGDAQPVTLNVNGKPIELRLEPRVT